MKVVFIIDHSPLMNLRAVSQVAQAEDGARQSGLTYFQQSVYAIEQFIQRRIALGHFKHDKYFLYGIESSEFTEFANIDAMHQEQNKKSKHDSFFEEMDDILETSSEATFNFSTPIIQKNLSATQSTIYSGWQHPYSHFHSQLLHLKCQNSPNDPSTLAKGVRQIMVQVNSKRMYSGADMRLYGVQLNKIEPCNVLLFTAAIEGQECFRSEEFLDVKPESQNLFKEIFRWDQKLNVVNFRADGKSQRGIFDEIVERYGGMKLDYQQDESAGVGLKGDFEGLKHFVVSLASSIESVALVDFEFRGTTGRENDEKESNADAPKSMNLYFQTIPTQMQAENPLGNAPLQSAHRSNSEIKEQRPAQKLKWPLPLDCQVDSSSINNLSSSIPKILIAEKPTRIFHDRKLGAWDPTMLADIITVHDPKWTQHFISKFLNSPESIEKYVLKNRIAPQNTYGWLVSMPGDLMKDRYFGYIRAVMAGHVAQSESIQLQLLVYPLDFAEFCELMASLNDYTQYTTSSQPGSTSNHKESSIQQALPASAQAHTSNSQNNQYGKFKWKLRFDTYKDRLPGMSGISSMSSGSIYGTARNGMMYAYCNDYINTCIRFVDQRNRMAQQNKQGAKQGVSNGLVRKSGLVGNSLQGVLLPETERVYREGRDGGGASKAGGGGSSSLQGGAAAVMRLDVVRNIRKFQQEIEIADEREFLQSKAEHERQYQMFNKQFQPSQEPNKPQKHIIRPYCCTNIEQESHANKAKQQASGMHQLPKQNENIQKDYMTKDDAIMTNQEENNEKLQYDFQIINQIDQNGVGEANLLDQVFWQINQLSFDTLEDIDFEHLVQNQIEKKADNKLNIQKSESSQNIISSLLNSNHLRLHSSNNLQQNDSETKAQHSLPICIMSDVETPFRMKLSQNSPNRLPRDPDLSHTEFIDKVRPYMGNPFYAPGTPGAKSMQKMAEEAAQVPKKPGNASSNGGASTATTASGDSNRSQKSSSATAGAASALADSPRHSQQSFDQISSISEESNFITDAQAFKDQKFEDLKKRSANVKPLTKTDKKPKQSKSKKRKRKENLEIELHPNTKIDLQQEMQHLFLQIQSSATQIHSQHQNKRQNENLGKLAQRLRACIKNKREHKAFEQAIKYYVRQFGFPLARQNEILNQVIP